MSKNAEYQARHREKVREEKKRFIAEILADPNASQQDRECLINIALDIAPRIIRENGGTGTPAELVATLIHQENRWREYNPQATWELIRHVAGV